MCFIKVGDLEKVKLKVFKNMQEHNILNLLNKGLLVTVNSDDPAYFGGYLSENYEAIATHLGLSREQLKILAKNSFKASFLDDARKRVFMVEIETL